MNDILDKNKEININEERIQNLLKLRKRNLNHKIFKIRLRKFNYNNINKNNEEKNNFEKEENLVFNEDDYLIDPDDLDINESIKKMDFIETENILNNIILLLNNKNDLNSILYGLLMMRKFTVIDAVLINKSELFIENNLYNQICNILFDFCNNRKIVFECLWILTRFVYDSKYKKIYYFLSNNTCIDLYKKILYCNHKNKLDFNIFLEEICTLILNLLVFKEKEKEDDTNIINCDLNEDYLINFLSELVDVIISMNISKEIYISFLIEITNCFDLESLLKNDILNKIINFLIEQNIKKLNNEINFYDEDIDMYYEENISYEISKSKIKTIIQISLIQLQYLLIHPLKEMPFDGFQKLSNEIIKRMEFYLDDKKNNLFYVGYINSYISYIAEFNIFISYEETKQLFDYLILNIKNKNKYINKDIIIECIEGLNNLSLKMILNKMFGLLVTELPNILLFIKNDNNRNHVSIKIVNEILNLLKTFLIEIGIKFHKELENEIFINVINCLKDYYDCEINNDVKYLLEQCYIIISKIIEINSTNKKGNEYIFLFEKLGMKEITYNLINSKINLPFFILNIFNIKI